MAIRTPFTELFGVAHPLALAPMGGVSGGALAAAVSEAGGLGLVGGGIADGRGVAAALMLGAQGAVLGTRFCATPESLYPDWAKKQLVAGGGDETSRTRVFDIARGLDWPAPYTGRSLRNAFADTWDGREEALRASAEAREQFTVGHQAGDPDVGLVWAGEGADLITAVEPAGDLVTRIMTQAEGLLREAPGQLDH
jgi:nitronate monooxygenase